jgi:hypothetical protein
VAEGMFFVLALFSSCKNNVGCWRSCIVSPITCCYRSKKKRCCHLTDRGARHCKSDLGMFGEAHFSDLERLILMSTQNHRSRTTHTSIKRPKAKHCKDEVFVINYVSFFIVSFKVLSGGANQRAEVEADDTASFWQRFLYANSLPPRPSTRRPTRSPTIAPFTEATSFPTVADQNAVTICIAVIDESSQAPAIMTSQWDTLRATFPDRPFCLLQPNMPGGDPPETALFRPVSFDNDPLTTFSFVNRQDTDDPSAVSDWYQICQIDAYRSQGLNRVSLFIDVSGSLVAEDVSLSIALFEQRVLENGINSLVDEEQNGSEDWIDDCINSSIP